MHKPVKPKKKIVIESSANFWDWDFTCKKVSLNHFLDWCKTTIPSKAKDVTIELEEEWQYDDCIVSLKLSWKHVISDPSYEKEMIKYKKKLAKWKKTQ